MKIKNLKLAVSKATKASGAAIDPDNVILTVTGDVIHESADPPNVSVVAALWGNFPSGPERLIQFWWKLGTKGSKKIPWKNLGSVPSFKWEFKEPVYDLLSSNGQGWPETAYVRIADVFSHKLYSSSAAIPLSRSLLSPEFKDFDRASIPPAKPNPKKRRA